MIILNGLFELLGIMPSSRVNTELNLKLNVSAVRADESPGRLSGEITLKEEHRDLM